MAVALGRERPRQCYNPPPVPAPNPSEIHVDMSLLERIVAADQAALGELYDRYSRLMYGVILRIVRERAEAEEVLQEVFVQVWTRAQSYDASLGSPAGWLVRIARNRAIDRRRANNARVAPADIAAVEPVAAADPEASATSGERQRRVAHALAALPRQQRELIELAYFLGLTQSELARRFGLPLGTVKTRMRTGMLALREQFQQMMIGL